MSLSGRLLQITIIRANRFLSSCNSTVSPVHGTLTFLAMDFQVWRFCFFIVDHRLILPNWIRSLTNVSKSFWGGRKGLRWCSFTLFLVRFCGNFYFNSRYCGFKTQSGLRLLQPLGRGFRWKSVCGADTLYNGRHPVTWQARAKYMTHIIGIWFVVNTV